ncbi:MAG: dihydrofolate reductase family protein [Nocardioides sp.]|uniref:dihydrofolate reductase family protein n=1 Tax=Nocardioides sp. TaxID=35761 RepID=UPI003EFEBCD5
MEFRHLSDLSDADLVEAYAPPRLPWFRMNFVSTVDGAAQGSDGLSGGINNEADKRAYDALRSRADVVVVGAGTARAEEYGVPDVPIVVVTRSGVVPTKLLGAPAGRVLLATVATSPGLASALDELGEGNVLVCGVERVDLGDLVAQLADRGFGELLCEGGPSLFADALAAGVVDELCLSLVPRVVAGERKRITDGPDVDATLDLTLLLEQDGTLLGRWLVNR